MTHRTPTRPAKLLSVTLLAICLAAFPALAAHAENDCPPGQPLCLFPSKPSDSPKPDPTTTARPTTPPAPEPAPVAPAPPAAPAPAASTAAPAPAEPGPTTTGSPSAASTSTVTPIPSMAAASAAPSSEPNWNKPVESSKRATQAAAVVAKDVGGVDLGGLMAIMGGVLLIGLAGLAFALWSRNRLAQH
ncbi:hypothetical protein [Arthrobacter sp. M4]|uniref:hypothetical protein n=1 Tax=Arthrobacter sp. M4 TaxID=218160 RepID=UPI001CDBB63D|nr:hypothetical protein [Arthrobacter sp. M4]MCA4133673.1 hypothetical protein [Arthrobacter sp. M4]